MSKKNKNRQLTFLVETAEANCPNDKQHTKLCTACLDFSIKLSENLNYLTLTQARKFVNISENTFKKDYLPALIKYPHTHRTKSGEHYRFWALDVLEVSWERKVTICDYLGLLGLPCERKYR